MRIGWMALVLAALALLMPQGPAAADGGYGADGKARRHAARRGGYSYSYEDAINTYGDSRGRYGSARSFRDPGLDRQTQGGPFDHGFFFDSGVAPRGGDSPYQH